MFLRVYYILFDFEHDSYLPHVSSLMWLDIYFDDGDPPSGNTQYGNTPKVPSIQV